MQLKLYSKFQASLFIIKNNNLSLNVKYSPFFSSKKRNRRKKANGVEEEKPAEEAAVYDGDLQEGCNFSLQVGAYNCN